MIVWFCYKLVDIDWDIYKFVRSKVKKNIGYISTDTYMIEHEILMGKKKSRNLTARHHNSLNHL